LKLLFENWRKLLEGEVLDFPHRPKVSEEDLQKVIALDYSLRELLKELYGNISEIPIDVDRTMDALVNSVEASLTK